jgi:hypothetical protein
MQERAVNPTTQTYYIQLYPKHMVKLAVRSILNIPKEGYGGYYATGRDLD